MRILEILALLTLNSLELERLGDEKIELTNNC
jgi:hypothetical protein